MKLGIYSYFNKGIGAFDTRMQFDDHDEKAVVYGVARAFKARCVLGTYNDLHFLQFFKLGTFDDETGEFVADKKLLLDFDKEISLFENTLKESKENGESSN